MNYQNFFFCPCMKILKTALRLTFFCIFGGPHDDRNLLWLLTNAILNDRVPPNINKLLFSAANSTNIPFSHDGTVELRKGIVRLVMLLCNRGSINKLLWDCAVANENGKSAMNWTDACHWTWDIFPRYYQIMKAFGDIFIAIMILIRSWVGKKNIKPVRCHANLIAKKCKWTSH